MSRHGNGTDQRVVFGYIPSTSPHTVAIWVNLDTDQASIVGYFSSADSISSNAKGVTLQKPSTDTGVVAVGADGTNFKTVSSTSLVGTGVWKHIIQIYNTTDLRLYFGGAEEGTPATYASQVDAASDNLAALDQVSFSGREMDGLSAELTVWNVALNAAERKALSKGVNPFAIRNESQQSNHPMYGVHDPEVDLTGNGHTGTVTGATKGKHPSQAELLENYL